MYNNLPFEANLLEEFIKIATKNTYAAGKLPEAKPERQGFTEYTYKNGDFLYKDSYAGFLRSRGMEVVRYKNKIVWCSMYGGGVTSGNENLAKECFDFLKDALSQKVEGSISFRGAKMFEHGDWKHIYQQEGNVEEFSGDEEILYKGDLVFFHKIIGGVVIGK